MEKAEFRVSRIQSKQNSEDIIYGTLGGHNLKEIKFSENVSRIDTSGIRKIFEAAGSNAINLGLGQPDFDTPDHIKAAAIKAINEGFTGYTAGPGIPELREALSQKFKEENCFSVSPQEIIVTSGASEALTIALTALLNRGDEVLISNPGFVSYNALTEMLYGKVVNVPLGEDLTMKPEDVLERITPKTKLSFLTPIQSHRRCFKQGRYQSPCRDRRRPQDNHNF